MVFLAWNATDGEALSKIKVPLEALLFQKIPLAERSVNKVSASPNERFSSTSFDKDWSLRPGSAPLSVKAKSLYDSEPVSWTLGKRNFSRSTLRPAVSVTRQCQVRESSPVKLVKDLGLTPLQKQLTNNKLFRDALQPLVDERPESKTQQSSPRVTRKSSTSLEEQDSKSERPTRELVKQTTKQLAPATDPPQSQSKGSKKWTGHEKHSLKGHAKHEQIPYEIAQQALELFWEFSALSKKDIQYAAEGQLKLRNFSEKGYQFSMEELGTLPKSRLEKICCKMAGVNRDEDLVPEFRAQARSYINLFNSQTEEIDFKLFMNFVYNFSFSEELLLDSEKRRLRVIAREHKIHFQEVDRYKAAFDQANEDRSGLLLFDEFWKLINVLMNLPAGSSMPEKKVRDMWAQTNRKLATALTFEEFFTWYHKPQKHSAGERLRKPQKSRY